MGAETAASSGGISLGDGNYVDSSGSFAAGEWNFSSSSPRSVILGSGNYIEAGADAVAIGRYHEIEHNHSTAIGYLNSVKATHGMTIGRNLFANSHAMLAVGRYNKYPLSGASPSTWVGTDQLFVIGNGTGPSTNDRSNAMVVYKSGDVEMTEGEVTIARIPAQGGILMGDFGTPP